MKKIIIVLFLFYLFGCSYNKQIKELEKRVDLLEMRAEDHEDLLKVSHKLTKDDKKHLIEMMRKSRKICQPGWKYINEE